MASRKTRKQATEDTVDESTEEKVEKNKPFVPKDPTQWMFLMKNDAIQRDGNVENKPTLCPLRHPKTDQKSMFLFANGDQDVYEVFEFKEDFRSWLIGNHVQYDGRLFVTTVVDPLFLVLPYLITAAKSGKFMTLDQIVVDEEYPECVRLHQVAGLCDLDKVTEVRGADDLKAYKYDQDKTLSWLKLKTEKVADVLERKHVCVTGAFNADLVTKAKPEEYMRYAFGMVSDYLPVSLASTLREHLGIPVVSEKRSSDNPNPPSKRAKLEDITPNEDYSKNVKSEKTNKPKATSTAQKKLEKVDKSGMKSMMSFFSPKPAKTS